MSSTDIPRAFFSLSFQDLQLRLGKVYPLPCSQAAMLTAEAFNTAFFYPNVFPSMNSHVSHQVIPSLATQIVTGSL